MANRTSIHTLTAAGVALVVVESDTTLPRVLHWGRDLGLTETDAAQACKAAGAGAPAGALPLLPTQADDWSGRPAVLGERAGQWPHLRLRPSRPVVRSEDADGATRLTVEAADTDARITVRTDLRLTAQGVLGVTHTVTNSASSTTPWNLHTLRSVLPVPEEATELLDLTGRWGLERVPQRHAFTHGIHAREGRTGRPGHDAATLLAAGTPGFGFGDGEVWAVHTAWSGDSEHYAERFPDCTGLLAGAELLHPGEISLGPGESYTTPEVFFVHSTHGLDGISDRLHRMLRARPQHPRAPRPVTLNTWEAVYFDHDLDRLKALADRAAQVGAERFVLDDGWFRGRRHDRAGLGDWYVDDKVWPDGLHPLVDHVRGLGMQFGLWVEPEMVNPDSDLARDHPDWLLAAPGRLPHERRNQHVLDLAHPKASAYVLARLEALLDEYPIPYLKWDHNRPLVEAVHEGRAGVHAQTRALYALVDTLKARHPGLEIESCASGGGRVDLGILQRTDRVWASDTNDPLDRQRIQRWTTLLLPPELVGSHVGPTETHVTHRVTRLAFRCATALFAHAGLEWDLTTCTPDELDELKAWTDAYKRLRPLIHSGTVVRTDLPDPTALLHGVVAHDMRSAVYCYAQLDSPVMNAATRVKLPGLDPHTRYRVRLTPELARLRPIPEPLGTTGIEAIGAVLAHLGIGLHRLAPADAVVLEVEEA
ncbi:alpha-galactosidase [Streptacidiphilus fuscans]|uniref:alpha-galactosidase n=1 Tax=Streptacidiphilus fuscans TaxID=2789292 RepID=A0A931BBX2_9ACTN|nr:alpha-galactosidase [Streptacidiphilus fuscans]MBF9072781.1 alpha-galactosidase [Streptacidiphilus fuscans]